MGLSDLTDGAADFINFLKELIDADVPLMLPKRNIVMEVLEREQAPPSAPAAA